MDRLLTVRELAERLNIAQGTAYRWVAEGRPHCVRFSSRCVRFRESDVKKDDRATCGRTDRGSSDAPANQKPSESRRNR
jgi:excisionase family DNA binding protein